MQSGHETVYILDFGAQYAQLIARRVREHNCYCEIVPCGNWCVFSICRSVNVWGCSGMPGVVWYSIR